MKKEINDWENGYKKKRPVLLKILNAESQGTMIWDQQYWNAQEPSKILGICPRPVFGNLLSFPNKKTGKHISCISVCLNHTQIESICIRFIWLRLLYFCLANDCDCPLATSSIVCIIFYRFFFWNFSEKK